MRFARIPQYGGNRFFEGPQSGAERRKSRGEIVSIYNNYTIFSVFVTIETVLRRGEKYLNILDSHKVVGAKSLLTSVVIGGDLKGSRWGNMNRGKLILFKGGLRVLPMASGAVQAPRLGGTAHDLRAASSITTERELVRNQNANQKRVVFDRAAELWAFSAESQS